MNENRLTVSATIGTVIVPVLSLLLAAYSVMFSGRQYAESNERALELGQKQQQLQMKSNTYFELCTSAGAMSASAEEPDSFKVARKKFETCYYGTIVLVDDSLVEKSLIELKSLVELIDIRNPRIDHATFLKLQGRTKFLSDACKASLESRK